LSVVPQDLRSATNDSIPSTIREPETIGTAAIAHDTLLQFRGLGKGARIINTDGTNNLVYRLHSNTAIARTIPPSSEILIQEWFTQIFITPDGTTGAGQLELEIAKVSDSLRQ